MADNDTTHQLPAGEPPAEPPRKEPKRLLRTRSDRMIAGVAGGLGRYFDVDPVIFRIGFAISVFLGGLGILAYVALALFVPSGDDGVGEAAPIERSRGLAIAAGAGILILVASWGVFDVGFGWHDGGPWFLGGPLVLIALAAGLVYLLRNTERTSFLGIVGRIALAIVAIGLLSTLALASGWAGATGHGVAVAGVVIAIGVLLVIAAFRGGARWLIVPAIVLAVPLGAVAAADIRFGDGIGEREYTPTSVAAIPDDGYELGIGRLAVDLRELEWKDDTVLDLNVDLGVGELIVAVPEDVCVAADASATAGRIEIGGSESDGLDIDVAPDAVDGSPPRLDLNGELDFGELLVINDDDAQLGGRGPRNGFDDLDSAENRQADMRAACAPEPARPAAETAGAGAGRRNG